MTPYPCDLCPPMGKTAAHGGQWKVTERDHHMKREGQREATVSQVLPLMTDKSLNTSKGKGRGGILGRFGTLPMS